MAGNDSLLSRTSEILAGVLLALAFDGIQVLIGGTRLVCSLPIYALLGLAGILAVLSSAFWRTREEIGKKKTRRKRWR